MGKNNNKNQLLVNNFVFFAFFFYFYVKLEEIFIWYCQDFEVFERNIKRKYSL